MPLYTMALLKIKKIIKLIKFRNEKISIYIIDPDGKRKSVKKIKGLVIHNYGNNNTAEFQMPVNFINTKLFFYNSNSSFSIKSSLNGIVDSSFYLKNNTAISIGKNLEITKDAYIVAGHDAPIHIGDNCLFAAKISIRSSDGHNIYTKDTLEVINGNKPVIVENSVWLGYDCLILRGAIVRKNSIVGAKALVNKPFNVSNVIIAGVPARIIKENISWSKYDGLNED